MSGTEDSATSFTGSWCSLDAAELAKAFQDKEIRIRREQAEQGQIIAQMESRGTLALYGYSSTACFLQDLVHISRAEATSRVARARFLNPVSDISSVTEASAPLTNTAALEGALGANQIDAITTVLDELPEHTSVENRNSAEKILVDLAREAGPRAINRAGKEILAHLDPDGSLPTERELIEPRRELRVHQRRDGWLLFKGALDPETSASFQALLSPLAKPRPSSEDGPDYREHAERYGDALAEIIKLASRSTDLPAEAGERPQVVVTLDLAAIRTGLGRAHLDLVGNITASQARRLACDAQLIPVVLGSRGEPLDVGRTHRLVTPAQRRALNLRDHGCAFPGCDRPPRHCEAHHIVHWSNGGKTSLDNLVSLCGRHHRLLHHSPWTVHIGHGGLPEFIPPRWIDPSQKPRHNRVSRT